jgi:hypothetical protein
MEELLEEVQKDIEEIGFHTLTTYITGNPLLSCKIDVGEKRISLYIKITNDKYQIYVWTPDEYVWLCEAKNKSKILAVLKAIKECE